VKRLSFAIAAVSVGLPSAASAAGVVSIGTPIAAECYRYAEFRTDAVNALRTCTTALDGPLDVENRAATHVNRGIIRMLRQDFTGAEVDFNAALALDPTLPDAWLNKAFLRLRMEDGEAALQLLERAFELRPRRPALAYLARGIAHELSGDVRAAYADLNRARDLEPGWDLPAQELSRYRVVQR
jgi:tetratricopeptide (TPR) repeat protein